MNTTEGAHLSADELDVALPAAEPVLTQLAPDSVLGPGYLTLQQLRELESNLTMGDSYRAMQDAPDDRNRMGLLAFWYSAKRTGLITQDTSLETFLDRIRTDDFNAVMGPEAQLAKATASSD